MVIPDKIYTDNPFVDNVIHYCKILALNCTIKDEDEALNNETSESLSNGNLLIACVEGKATYEVFSSIPKEILEKYIAQKSNLDLYVDDVDALEVYFKSFSDYQRTILFRKISSLARTIYIDHYDTMMHYLNNTEDTWLEDNKDLYNKCVNKTATYNDLFDALPYETTKRIIKQYLNNYNITEFEDIISSLEAFNNYIGTRTDTNVNTEINNISSAMCSVFASHYDMMVERGYLSQEHNKWLEYVSYDTIYNKCKLGKSSYSELYDLFPEDDLLESLYYIFGQDTTDSFQLYRGLDVLDDYFNSYSSDPVSEKAALTEYMSNRYMKNYNPMMNQSIYEDCKDEVVDYWDLNEYIPRETLKIILGTYIKEVTNLDAYSNSKEMLNTYLASIPSKERDTIKKGITNDMMEWYPNNYVELNSYYRSLIGQPPMDENGKVFEDTLEHTYNSTTNSFISFGKRFTSMIPNNSYPAAHWRQPICDFDSYDINILEEYGVLDEYKEACIYSNVNDISGRYNYFKHLGDEALDIYSCRRAGKFQLIGVPSIDDSDAKNKFIDTFAINRDYVIRTVYSDAYKFMSDYYDKFMIIFILLNTIMDMLSEIPTYIINREVFDSRCIKYLFEANGIPYYSEIPIKYQRAMLKNLHTLIKYKSSTKNMVDICSLFGFDDVKVFNYYLFKSRVTTEDTGEYVFSENNDINYNIDKLYIKDTTGQFVDYNGARYSKLTDYRYFDESYYLKTIKVKQNNGKIVDKQIMNNDIDFYVRDPDDEEDFIRVKDLDYFTKIKADTKPAELKFIRVPSGENLTEYKNDPNYIDNYDDIVISDEGDTWDGGLDHEELKEKILSYEFNAVKSKYISIETVTEMTELAFQVSYFYNMLFDNFYSEDSLTVEVPYIKTGHSFRFMDIVCYLFALMYLYNGLEDNIMYSPTQILYVKGYNFNEALNEVLKDPNAFQQNDPISGLPLEDGEKYNIFNINDRIAEDGYDYQEAFDDYRITAFNLGVDIDELDKWLIKNYQMSLEDIIVDDSLDQFNQIITLRSFFSLNNSYYQKDIFTSSGNMLPLQYNQNIKYAFGYELYKKMYIDDGSDNPYIMVNPPSYTQIIDDSSDVIYIKDFSQYVTLDGNRYAPYYQFIKQNDGSYVRRVSQTYIRSVDSYSKLFDHDISMIRNSDQKCIFAADHYYRMVNGSYEEITENKYFMDDPYEEGKRILLFGEYYILNDDSEWELNPDNCYGVVVKNGEVSYILMKDIDTVENATISDDDCYVRHSDGHFIKLSETDYYSKLSDGKLVYNEEDLYVVADRETEYFDPSVEDRVYYMKLNNFYDENNSTVITSTLYVKDKDGNFIPETDLLDPKNCYFIDKSGEYSLVIEHMAVYTNRNNDIDVDHILVAQSTNDYSRLCRVDDFTYIPDEDPELRFVFNSDSEYALALKNNTTYDDTSSMIVVFNRYLDADNISDTNNITTNTEYDPEATDKVWDENDWFYTDPSYDPDNGIGMNGENKWYYSKPGSNNNESDDEEDEEDSSKEVVGSGFYIEASSYLGDATIDQGAKYYMQFNVETNFSGRIQISNEADSDCTSNYSREYICVQGSKFRVSQVFTANEVTRPTIRFLIYKYDEFPINIGDYIVVSNIQIMKSYNDNFIAKEIPSYDKLQELYRTNESIYKYLATQMANCSDYRTYNMYKHLYDAIMTSKYNKEAFKMSEGVYAKTYTDFLESRDAVLYEKLEYFKTLETETMQKEIADNIVEITYAIDGCVDTNSYGYLYSYFPAVSTNYIQQYISKIIDFFKSWKVHLLGINTVYKFDSELDNTIRVLERPEYAIVKKTDSNVAVYDSVKINPLDSYTPSGEKYIDVFPDMIKFNLNKHDNCRPHDRVRIISRDQNIIKYTDNYEEMHIVFEDDKITVNSSDGELIINSTNAGFKEENGNELVMTTDYNQNSVFESQIIDEINHFTKDIFEWEENEDE